MADVPRDPSDSAPLTREERLAAKLRENLRRRKAQARDLTAQSPADPGAGPGTLPKASGKS